MTQGETDKLLVLHTGVEGWLSIARINRFYGGSGICTKYENWVGIKRMETGKAHSSNSEQAG